MGILDEFTSRIKGAFGALIGNKEMKRSGQANHLAGKAKDVVGSAQSKAKDAIDSARDTARKNPTNP